MRRVGAAGGVLAMLCGVWWWLAAGAGDGAAPEPGVTREAVAVRAPAVAGQSRLPGPDVTRGGWWQTDQDPASRADGSGQAVGCITIGGDTSRCDRLARDLASRRPVLAADDPAARAAQERFDAATRGVACRPVTCGVFLLDALTAAGFAETTARAARGDDPAAAGWWVFGGSVGSACLVGGWSPEAGLGWSQVAGRLRDGTCLTP